MSIEFTQAGIVITFEGTLQSIDDIASGTWVDVPGNSPLTVTPAPGTAKFYRAKR